MLDAISDFWKPSKKSNEEDTIDTSSVKPGATIGFGFIPQSQLSGNRLTVKQINTYLFGDDRMTSFVLDAGADESISMIIADGEQEKYVAISRKISFADRSGLYTSDALLAAMDDEKKRLTIQKNEKWSAWTAPEYKKIISNLKGEFAEADYRSFERLPKDASMKAFNYTLLVSNNNEHALEIEQYSDNRMEVYATVYRRLADIGEIVIPDDRQESLLDEMTPAEATLAVTAKRELPTFSSENVPLVEAAVEEKPLEMEASAPVSMKSEPVIGSVLESSEVSTAASSMVQSQMSSSDDSQKESSVVKVEFSQPTPVNDGPAFSSDEKPANLSALPETIEPVKEAIPSLKKETTEDTKAVKEHTKTSELSEETVEEMAMQSFEENKVFETFADDTTPQTQSAEEMSESITTEDNAASSAVFQPIALAEIGEEQRNHAASIEQSVEEIAPTTTHEYENKEQPMATFNANLNGSAEQKTEAAFQARAIPTKQQEVENDSVECELPAASRIIEEAISNEMSMSDVIRRVIALPVARQESVSIPILLTDSDYSLLAVRYGIPAADRAAIKAKIIEEIGDFSTATKQ